MDSKSNRFLLSLCYVFMTVLHILEDKDVMSPLKDIVIKSKDPRRGQTLTKLAIQVISFSQQNSSFLWVAIYSAPSHALSKPSMAFLFSFLRTFLLPGSLTEDSTLAIVLSSSWRHLCEDVMPGTTAAIL